MAKLMSDVTQELVKERIGKGDSKFYRNWLNI